MGDPVMGAGDLICESETDAISLVMAVRAAGARTVLHTVFSVRQYAADRGVDVTGLLWGRACFLRGLASQGFSGGDEAASAWAYLGRVLYLEAWLMAQFCMNEEVRQMPEEAEDRG